MENLSLKVKETNSKGITLVWLIVSIIVLLILATVSINLVMNKGILDKAKSAVDKYSEGEIGEQIKLAYLEWQTAQLTGTNENANDFIKNRLNSAIGDVEDVNKTGNSIMITFKNNKIYSYNISTGKALDLTNTTSISKDENENFVGCYADIDADGTVAGVIFADLLTGSIKETQQWENENRTYTIPTENANDLKDYYISKDNHEGTFGIKDVLSPKGKGKDRFYIMSLNNLRFI